MPFMHGMMPLRQTYFYLNQGKIFLRDAVKIFSFSFRRKPPEEQRGAREFIFWHWAQLQYHNPTVQCVKHVDLTPTPFAQVFLEDGREILFDFDRKSREEIVDIILKTLGKSETVRARERIEAKTQVNPACFGEEYDRQCMCEIQGQHPCTRLLVAPKYMKGSWRWGAEDN